MHKPYRNPEQTSCLVLHHGKILLLRRTHQRVSPVQVHALAAVQIQHLLGKDLKRALVIELCQLLLGKKVGIVGGVDGLRNAKDTVRDWYATT